MRENVHIKDNTLQDFMRLTSPATRLASLLWLVATATAQAEPPSPLRPFIGVGYTSGGDTIAPVTVQVQNSSVTYKESISAGAGPEARAGLAFRPAGSPFSLRASLGVHNDQSNSIDGGEAFFRRYPVELQAVWHHSERLSLGLGARRSTRAVFGLNSATVSNGNGGTQIVSTREPLKAQVGWVAEAEWALTPSWGLSLRYVRERFKTEGDDPLTFKGDHLGVATQLYFF